MTNYQARQAIPEQRLLHEKKNRNGKLKYEPGE